MDGKLKLFDFGLCTCVKRRQSSNESYEMTGNTGSLRYMAPEVALKAPYSEKADVYSFGIMIWQMARDRVPFKGKITTLLLTHSLAYSLTTYSLTHLLTHFLTLTH